MSSKLPAFEPRDPKFATRVAESFSRQAFLKFIGATLSRVEPGLVEVVLPLHEHLTQQHGYGHAGVTTTLADVAGGYAAATLNPQDREVLTVEMKINLLAPAEGDSLRAEARVLRAGRRLITTEAEVYTCKSDGREEICAKMLQTIASVSLARS